MPPVVPNAEGCKRYRDRRKHDPAWAEWLRERPTTQPPWVLWANGVDDVGLWMQNQADEAVDLKITVEQREHK